MKKLLLSLSILLGTSYLASAQLIPNAQFGLKAGVNLSSFSTNSTFSSDKRAGYLGGVYARIGGLGFNFQPELYVTGKNLTIKDGTNENKAKFTSLDVPLLLGTKVGAFGFGSRFYAGPLVSFNINEDQSLGQGLSDAVTFKDYKKQKTPHHGCLGSLLQIIGSEERKEYTIQTKYCTGSPNSYSVAMNH